MTVVIYACLSVDTVLAQTEPKILYINSYHSGYKWSDGIERGIKDRLFVEDVEITKFYMNALRQNSPSEIKKSALAAKKIIDELQPDIVITSDDYAAKEIIAPFYKNSSIPFVFCGVDWDASVYGLPVSNVSGMLETDHIASVVDLIQTYASGSKIGFLTANDLSGHRSYAYYTQLLGKEFSQVYHVNSFLEWEETLIHLQEEVDMLILGNTMSIDGWETEVARRIILEKALVPIGSTDAWLAPLSLITIAKVPQEQGWWAANTAIQVMKGKPISGISVTKNREGRLIANLEMAERLDITLTQELIEIATLIGK